MVACFAVRADINLSGKFDGSITKVFLDGARIRENGFDDFVDQTEFQRSLRVDRLSRHTHVDGCSYAHDARKALRALGTGNDAKIDLRLANFRVPARNAVMACHGEFQSSAKCSAMDRHDDGFWKILDAPKKT